MAVRTNRADETPWIVFEHQGVEVDRSSAASDPVPSKRRHDDLPTEARADAPADKAADALGRERIRAEDAYAGYIAYRASSDWRDNTGAVAAALGFARNLRGVRRQRGIQSPDRPPYQVHALGVRYLDELTSSLIADHVQARRTERPKCAEASLKQEMQFLVKTCNYFRDEGYRVPDRLEVPKIGGSQRRERVITSSEVQEMREALARQDSDHLDFFNVLRWTGLRTREVSKLEWSGVDFDERSYEVRRSKRERRVIDTLTMEGKLLDLMKRRFDDPRRHSVYVFANSGGTGHRGTSMCWWNNAIEGTSLNTPEKLDVEAHPRNHGQALTPHFLRHAFATALARSGRFSHEQIGHLLGHTDVRSTSRYIHVIDKSRSAEAAEIMRIID